MTQLFRVYSLSPTFSLYQPTFWRKLTPLFVINSSWIQEPQSTSVMITLDSLIYRRISNGSPMKTPECGLVAGAWLGFRWSHQTARTDAAFYCLISSITLNSSSISCLSPVFMIRSFSGILNSDYFITKTGILHVSGDKEVFFWLMRPRLLNPTTPLYKLAVNQSILISSIQANHWSPRHQLTYGTAV